MIRRLRRSFIGFLSSFFFNSYNSVILNANHLYLYWAPGRPAYFCFFFNRFATLYYIL